MNVERLATVSRRGFAAGLATTWLSARPLIGAAAPNNRIAVGVIGLGSRGFNLIDELLAQDDVDIRALCDVDEYHYRDRPWGKGKAYGRRAARDYVLAKSQTRGTSVPRPEELFVTADYREVCGRETLDAVVVATPDHWHAKCTLDALRNGKDVYCEKPVTHTFYEGQQVYREVAKRNAVFQTGSQQRSDSNFRRAVELVRNGHLGQLQRVLVGLPPGYESPQGSTAVTTPPKTLDYDRWCGPAPKLPYMRARHHRWWRGHRAYGGGVLMDWIGHHNDIAHWAMNLDSSGPTRVEATGWTKAETAIYDTPVNYGIACEYANGVHSLISSKNPLGVKLIGERGWVFVSRGKITASNSRWLADDFQIGPEGIYASPGHMRDFLNAMRLRKPCVAPAETAHRSITPGHLAYVSNQLGRPLRWDADRERILDDDQANRLLLRHEYRSPWSL